MLATTTLAYAALHVGLTTVGETSRYLSDPVFADKERKLARLERTLPSGCPMVVFIGTSRTGNGFDAGRAQDELTSIIGPPVGAFNFGIPASGPVTHLLHLRRILADGHKPALLLLEILPPTVAELPNWPLEGRFVDGVAMNREEIDWSAHYGFPTDKLHKERQQLLVAPWWALRFQTLGRISPTALPFGLRYDWSRGPDPNGWSPLLVEEVTEQERAAGLEHARVEYQTILATLKLRGKAAQALRDLLTLCREERIPVVLVRMPEGSPFRAFYPPPVAAHVEQFLNDLCVEYGCRVCNAREWMPDGAFKDGHHLLRSGATVFSERLAREAIAPALATARAP